RAVYVAFDSDAATNRKVQSAELALAGALQAVGAKVSLLRLPSGQGGAKVGLDDFLVAQGPGALRGLMEKAAPAPEAAGRPLVFLSPREDVVTRKVTDALAADDEL